LASLAMLYRKMGDYTKAETLYKRSLPIIENALGGNHPYLAEVLQELALFYSAKADIGQAIVTLSRANEGEEHNFALVLALGSERQKLAYIDTYSMSTNFTLTLQSEFAPNDPQALRLAFTTILRRKARALDAMTDTIVTLRRNATPEDRKLFDQLKENRSQLAALMLNDPGEATLNNYRTQVKAIEDKIETLETRLSNSYRSYPRQSRPITVSAVQAALPQHAALIEFTYFTPINPKTDKEEPPRYLAYLLAPEGEPKWVDLGEAAPIDRAIENWRMALRNPKRTDVTRLACIVDEKIMRPVRSLLRETKADTQHLMIAPDGLLNLIPFAALVDEQNKYLIERYTISYLSSGRDLLRLHTSDSTLGAPPLLIANPDFGRLGTVAMRGGRDSRKSHDQSNPPQVYFAPLPTTEDEALAIKALLPNASLLERENATETALKQCHGPQILHIATHGFFIDYNGPSQSRNGVPREPSANNSKPLPYTIQIEAAPALETAQEKVKELKAQGIDAYIVKTEIKGKGTFFRVRVGNFRSQTEAQKYGADQRGRGAYSDFYVARYEAPQQDLVRHTDLRLSKLATRIKDPLLRSGLALAGANQGKSGDDDGILTALEAADLDLLGTKLVVLSACDTGVGEVRKGEGVQGLRRALVLAGSESQVMSLWPVSDEATKDLMISYYKALQEGKGRSEGLRLVQLRTLHGRKDHQHPFYWAAFIQSGVWASLVDLGHHQPQRGVVLKDVYR
ncbi:MAG: CHAT domain-containing protein, partial [Blastocatellia bacterium]|nr:CHAT domain-containing protein [Blastocatellia bacterium]